MIEAMKAEREWEVKAMDNGDRAWGSAFIGGTGAAASIGACAKMSWETPLPLLMLIAIVVLTVVAVHNIARR